MQKDVTIEKSLCYFVACAKAAMESLQRLRPSLNRTPAWTVNEDPAVQWRGSSSDTGSSIETQTALPVFHLEHRPAPTRQANEHHRELWHHRPEQENARGRSKLRSDTTMTCGPAKLQNFWRKRSQGCRKPLDQLSQDQRSATNNASESMRT